MAEQRDTVAGPEEGGHPTADCFGPGSQDALKDGQQASPSARVAERDICCEELREDNAATGAWVTPTPDSRESPDARESVAKGAPVFADLEDYEILGELGRGGMGVVYKAREKSVHRVVALKMMLAGRFASPQAARRFRLEAEAVASLDHPDIIPIYRVGEADGKPYFTMKYIEGTGLDQRKSAAYADPKVAARLIHQVSLAVHYAHQRGILHRDLKPGNILIDERGRPHVTDFGLAKRLDQDRGETETGTVMGTPDYMSPEQASGQIHKVCVASDVYSLGSILFDLLTGAPPFRSPTAMQTLLRVAHETPRAPTLVNRGIGPDLETICLKCLEKDPEQRYGSAQELADELQRYLVGEPIRARPVHRLERFRRWCQRNPAVAGLLTAVGALLIAWLVGVNFALVRISRERDAARQSQEAAERNEQAAIAARRQASEQARVAERARDSARYSEALTHETLYDVVNVFQDSLRGKPDMQQLRQQLLAMALERLDAEPNVEEAENYLTDADKALRAAAGAYQRGGGILLEMGLARGALNKYQLAMTLVQQMHDAAPDVPRNKRNMAACLNNLADTHRQLGQLALAREHYEQGLEYRKAWVRLLTALPQVDKWALVNAKWDTAVSCSLLCDLYLALGDPVRARQYLAESDEWGAAVPDDAVFESAKDFGEKASHYARHGDVSLRFGDVQAAQASYERAVDLVSRGLQQIEGHIGLQGDLAAYHLRLGDLHSCSAQNPGPTRSHYEQAATLAEHLYQLDPRTIRLARLLADSYYKQGTLALRQNEMAASADWYRQCLDLLGDVAAAAPDYQPLQVDLMMVMARCGRYEEADQIAEQIRARTTDPAGAYAAACCYAVCVATLRTNSAGPIGEEDRQQMEKLYGSKALDALKDARGHGWKDVESLKQAADFDALRDSSAFEELLRQLPTPIASTDPVSVEHRLKATKQDVTDYTAE